MKKVSHRSELFSRRKMPRVHSQMILQIEKLNIYNSIHSFIEDKEHAMMMCCGG